MCSPSYKSLRLSRRELAAWLLVVARPRDAGVPPLRGLAGRLDRVLRNLLANSSLFAATVLAAHASNTHNGLTEWGARLFYFWARVAYVLLYAAEVPLIHSLIWGTSRTSASCCSPPSS